MPTRRTLTRAFPGSGSSGGCVSISLSRNGSSSTMVCISSPYPEVRKYLIIVLRPAAGPGEIMNGGEERLDFGEERRIGRRTHAGDIATQLFPVRYSHQGGSNRRVLK